jgi:TonB family protein
MIDFLYIIQINIFLAVMGLGVYLATKAQSYHNANRALIMGTVLLAFVVPIFDLATNSGIALSGVLEALEIKSSGVGNVQSGQWNFIDYLSIFYLAGVLISFLVFTRNLKGVIQLTGFGNLFKSQIISSEKIKTTASFFRTIFLQPSLSDGDKDLIEQHEIVHTRELHSLDILLIQLAKALCWFNPVIYLLEHQLKATHEFRADEVVAGKTDHSHYSYLLISQAVGVDSNVLMHPFSRKNLLKQRINMLNNKPRQIMKYFLIIPTLVAAIFIVSCTKENPATTGSTEHRDAVEKSSANQDVTPDVKPIFAKGEQSLIEFMSSEIKYPKECEAEGIEGTVLVNFTIDEQGNSGNFKVLKSPDERLSMAALDVMAKMPEWTPAQLDGKPVKMELTLPIKYALN